MKKRKTRLGVWSLLIIVLTFAAVYFYVTKSNNGDSGSNGNGKKEPVLIYLKQNSSRQSLIRYSLSTQSESTIVGTDKVGAFVNLVPSGQENKSFFLHTINNKSLVDLLDVKTGEIDPLGDVTEFKPAALYPLKNGNFALFRVSDKHIIVLDDQFRKLSEHPAEADVTCICSTSDGALKYSSFDGSASTLVTLSPNKPAANGSKIEGKIYSFSCEADDQNVLYAKKIVSKDQVPDSTSSNTFWKIAIIDLATGKESILSDGNFDQNPIANNDYSLFAYQKKYDTADQEDGRIFILDTKNKKDRLGAGVPLQFIY